MNFKNKQHEENYNRFLSLSHSKDSYHKALFYLLALDDSLVNNINSLYSFQEDEIIFEGLDKAFQTSGSLRVTRLAINLFSSVTFSGQYINEDEGYKDDAKNYAPDNIFNDANIFYFFEALLLRFPNLSDELPQV